MARAIALATLSVQAAGASVETAYDEPLRPQFHFTPAKDWMNDPNGLVYYNGEYHLFFQYNLTTTGWKFPSQWGHAVSRDLVQWTQLPIALAPDELGNRASGSAVVDWDNTAGFKTGDADPMVAVFTAMGDRGQIQCLAYSNDAGRTFTTYKDNPVISEGERDPRVFWHEPTRRWVMALYAIEDGVQGIRIFNSANLKRWAPTSFVAGFYECPDLYPLPLDGDRAKQKWVILGANGDYRVGSFDGRVFTPETGTLKTDLGANFYASQTWGGMPAEDGRRIQIAWMASEGRYPGMPFNQQMSFPCELTLRSFADGPRQCRLPVREIESLYGRSHRWRNASIKPGEDLLSAVEGDLFDISAEIDPGAASEVGFKIRGNAVSYTPADGKLTCLGRSADMGAANGPIRLRILVDRTSVEVFGDDGRVSMTSCFQPDPANKSVELYSTGAPAKAIALDVHELKSAWRDR